MTAKLIVHGDMVKFPSIECSEDGIKMSGRSLPDNVLTVFEPVLDWVVKNKGKLTEGFPVDLNLEYLNTSSLKMLTSILIELRDVKPSISWAYEDDDEDMLIIGEDLEFVTKLKFSFVEIEN